MKLGTSLRSLPVLLGILVVALTACQKKSGQEITSENVVVGGDPKTARVIGDSETKYVVLGNQAMKNRMATGEIEKVNSKAAQTILNDLAKVFIPKTFGEPGEITDEALALGFPVGLLGERQLFGGAITKVSDKTSVTMGMLRLSDVPPLHVRAFVGKSKDDKFFLSLVGCPVRCTEGSAEMPLLNFPILGVDKGKNVIMVDLGALGKDLNMVKMKDPTGLILKLKPKSSATVSFDYSVSSLVFDVKSVMVPYRLFDDEEDNKDKETETVFVARWYLRLASAFDSAFEPRTATTGIGYFLTKRGASPRIQRFAKPAFDGEVKYYVKNVPKEFQPSFAAAFDSWNDKFKTIIGKKLLSYEFLEPSDPRYNLVTAGDIRYNVLEWDIDNLAPYGGFGPSTANQLTGQTLSANVLVQGPRVVSVYSKWFLVSKDAEELVEKGHAEEAVQLMANFEKSISEQQADLSQDKYSLSLTDGIDFVVQSQTPPLEDPAFSSEEFDLPPKGITYAKYMDGYFMDMIAHELGHNLGLRHNFRGNMSAKNNPGVGEVSHSVMEYLGKTNRYLDRIGPYDTMAIEYGYSGLKPDRTDMYCTDEEVPSLFAPDKSAECSRDDATSDPFGWFQSRLARATYMLVGKGSKDAPRITENDLDKEITTDVSGMGFYATSASSSGKNWTNFFNQENRPKDPSGVKEFVLKQFRTILCDSELAKIAADKTSVTAKEVAESNLKALRTQAQSVVTLMKAFGKDDLDCAK